MGDCLHQELWWLQWLNHLYAVQLVGICGAQELAFPFFSFPPSLYGLPYSCGCLTAFWGSLGLCGVLGQANLAIYRDCAGISISAPATPRSGVVVILHGCTCNYTLFQAYISCIACDELAQSVKGFVRHMTADRTCRWDLASRMLCGCPEACIAVNHQVECLLGADTGPWRRAEADLTDWHHTTSSGKVRGGTLQTCLGTRPVEYNASPRVGDIVSSGASAACALFLLSCCNCSCNASAWRLPYICILICTG